MNLFIKFKFLILLLNHSIYILSYPSSLKDNSNECTKCFNGHHLIYKNNLNKSFEIITNELAKCELNKINLLLTKIEANFEINWQLIGFDLNQKLISNELDNYGEHDFKQQINYKTEFKLFKSSKRKNYIEFVDDEFEFEDKIFYWQLDNNFIGNKLYSYDHKFKLKYFYSILRGDVSLETFKYFKYWPDLIIIANINEQIIGIGYKNYLFNLNLPDEINNLELYLNEKNWYLLNLRTFQLTDKQIDSSIFKLILMNIDKFLLRATFHLNQIEARLYSIELEQSILLPSSNETIKNITDQSTTQLNNKLNLNFNSSKVINLIESNKCKCLEPFDSTSLFCEKCKSGYFQIIHFNNQLTKKFKKLFLFECRLCDCNGQLCDSINGNCLCDHSTQGSRCEKCRKYFIGNPLKGKSCKKCTNNDNCTSCKDGFYLKDNNLEVNLINKNYTNDNSKQDNCVSCNCDLNGSLDNNCDNFTGQCNCKANYIGLKCSKCKKGFKLTNKNDCIEEQCWLTALSPHNICISKLNNEIQEFNFENKFNLINVIRNVSLIKLNNFELKYNQLKDKNNLLIEYENVIRKQNLEFNNLMNNSNHDKIFLKNSNDLFDLLNKKFNYNLLFNNLTELNRIGNYLSIGNELTFVKLIDIRNQISEQIDLLIIIKYQRLFDNLEKKKYYHDTSILLKRIKKEFRNDFYLNKLHELNNQLTDSLNLFKNIYEFNQMILSIKQKIISEFDRLFKIETNLRDQTQFIVDVEVKIDSANNLFKKLNKLFNTIEQLKNNIEDELVQLDQIIVDANYINNISSKLVNKLDSNIYEISLKLNEFNQNQINKIQEVKILNPDNEQKYCQICEIQLANLNSDLNYLQRTLNKEFFNKTLINNLTNLMRELDFNLDQFKELEFYIDKKFSSLNLYDSIKINNSLEIKSNQIIENTNLVNSILIDLDHKFEFIKSKIDKIQDKYNIIDQMGGNVKIRNEILMSIENDLNNLTRKSIINKYTDDNFISPIVELKIFHHELKLSYLNKELLPDCLKRLSNLKENLELQPLNLTIDEHIQHINSNIQIKKKYLTSFQIRSNKIDLINKQTNESKLKIDKLITQAKQQLSKIKLNLGMKYLDHNEFNCRRTYNLNLESSSLIDIQFYYSIDNQLSNKFNYTILMMGSIDKNFILFELLDRQIKVSWNFEYSSGHLLSSIKLKSNNDKFKYKDAYYRIEFFKITTEVNLIVSSFKNPNEKDENKLKINDLILKSNFNNRLELGYFNQTNLINQIIPLNSKKFTSVISNLEINKELIGLWNYETTTVSNSCIPIKDIISNDLSSNDILIFNHKNSYLELKQINRYEKHKYSITIEFKTFSNDGLLFLTFNQTTNDLISILIKNGRLQLTILTRNLQLNLLTKNKYNNGNWCTVTVEREDYLSIITTDDEQLEGYLKEIDSVNRLDENYLNFIEISTNNYTNKPNDLSTRLELHLDECSIFIGGLDQLNLFNFKSFYGAIKTVLIDSFLINLKNNQNSFGILESSSLNLNLINRIKFNSNSSFIKFKNLDFKNWSNFGFTFKIFKSLNCSILSLNNDLNTEDKREIAFNLINNKLVFKVIFNDEFNLTLLNNFNINYDEYHTILMINENSSVKIIIDNNHQMEILQNLDFENLSNLIEHISNLNLGIFDIQINDELYLENHFFNGIQKNFILNNKLINLNLHFDEMNDVEFL